MKRHEALLQEQADLIAEAKAAFATAEAEERGLTDDEAARDDAIHARLEVVKSELARFERQREAERSATAVTDHNVAAAQRAGRTEVEGVRDLREDDPTRGFAHVGEFARAVKAAYSPGGRVDERLRYGAAPTNYHYEVGSDEGRMVPPAFRESIWNAVEGFAGVWGDMNPEPTSRNAVEFLRDESTPWGAAGVQAGWRTESQQMMASKLKTDPSTLRLHELYAFVTATEELLQDAPRLNARLTDKAGQAIAWKITDAVVNGTGVGQPLGWFQSSALVTVAKTSGQAADTVTAKNVAAMYARMIDPSNAIWYINQDVLPELLTMTLGDKPIWFPPNGNIQNANADGGFLFGRPVRLLEACQTLGDAGDIQFVNPRGYYALQRTNMPDFASSMHLYFDYNMTAFRWTFRFGGQPFLSAPVAPAKGNKTRSHFVTLAARA